VLTVPVNLAGIPALSMPCGLAEAEPSSGRDLPAIADMGRPFDEESVLQEDTPWKPKSGSSYVRVRRDACGPPGRQECDPVVS
jgi:hypothetical protein